MLSLPADASGTPMSHVQCLGLAPGLAPDSSFLGKQPLGGSSTGSNQAESSLPTSQSWPCLCLAIGGIGGPNQQTATSLDPSTSRFLVFCSFLFFN